MPSTILIGSLTAVHAGSAGMAICAPDVCMTPSGPSPVPVPYVNVSSSSDGVGTPTVLGDGSPLCAQGFAFAVVTTGDEPGSIGGVVSGCIKGAAEFVSYAFDVFAEGKPVARLADLVLSNKGGTFNTPPAPEVQPNLPPPGPVASAIAQTEAGDDEDDDSGDYAFTQLDWERND